MNVSKLTLGLCGAASLVALGSGYMIWSQYGANAESREAAAVLRTSIDLSRKLLSGTPQVEKDVIVLRETEQAIKEILPDEQDLYNFHRDLQTFSEDSGVRVTSIKKKDAPGGAKKTPETFDKVTYELALEGDAFQVVAFLDRVESHQRFLRIPTISWTASNDKAIAETGRPAHKVKLEVETFVYRPQGGPEPVKIEGYPRKRELLLGEVARHREAVAVESYNYRGQRGRRDPWVDPRVPTNAQDPSALPIQEQSHIVDALVDQINVVKRTWDSAQKADTMVLQMTLRSEAEQLLAELEEATRLADGSVTFPMAQHRLMREVLEPMASLRNLLIASTGSSGPTIDQLKQVLQTMQRHIDMGEAKLALEDFKAVEPTLGQALIDPLRKAFAESLKSKLDEARILQEFESIKIDIKGVAIQDGRPAVALINGRALTVGDLIGDELIVSGIRPGEIEFLFRGVVLVRRF